MKHPQKKESGIFNENLSVFVINNKALFILVLLVIIATLATDGLFLGPMNLSSVARQIAVPSILGLGFTVILASGGIDLSIGFMLSMIGVVYAMMSKIMPLSLALLIALALGAVCGLINGFISMKFNLLPFIVTLATAQIFKGFAYLLCNGKSIAGVSDQVKFWGQGLLFGVFPISFAIVLVVLVIIAILLYRTKLGRYLLAVGGNIEAAKVSGINTLQIKIASFVTMGVCAAIGAVVLTGRVALAMMNSGEGMELDAIAAVVIGGTPMSGGKANVIGTLFGCIIMGIISNLLNLVGVNAFWQWVAKGLIIIIAMLIDTRTEAFFKKRQLG